MPRGYDPKRRLILKALGFTALATKLGGLAPLEGLASQEQEKPISKLYLDVNKNARLDDKDSTFVITREGSDSLVKIYWDALEQLSDSDNDNKNNEYLIVREQDGKPIIKAIMGLGYDYKEKVNQLEKQYEDIYLLGQLGKPYPSSPIITDKSFAEAVKTEHEEIFHLKREQPKKTPQLYNENTLKKPEEKVGQISQEEFLEYRAKVIKKVKYVDASPVDKQIDAYFDGKKELPDGPYSRQEIAHIADRNKKTTSIAAHKGKTIRAAEILYQMQMAYAIPIYEELAKTNNKEVIKKGLFALGAIAKDVIGLPVATKKETVYSLGEILEEKTNLIITADALRNSMYLIHTLRQFTLEETAQFKQVFQALSEKYFE